MKPKIKILIADDHAIVRIGLSALLKTESDLSVVGVAKDGEEAVAEALRLNPDVIVMDLMMPKKSGVEATAEIHARLPEAKIVTTYGGRVEFVPLVEGRSTTNVIERIRSGA